jgi:hypothetical protein
MGLRSVSWFDFSIEVSVVNFSGDPLKDRDKNKLLTSLTSINFDCGNCVDDKIVDSYILRLAICSRLLVSTCSLCLC